MLVLVTSGYGQEEAPIGVPVPPLGDGPWVIDTAEQHKIRVSVVTKGLEHPWAIAFLPDDAMLITERPGRLRMVRDGVLDPQAVSGVPEVRTDGNGGLMDVALHPEFADNGLVYLTYTKGHSDGLGSPALARGRLDGHALHDVEDLIVTEPFHGNSGLNGRVAFGRDGKVYMSTGGRIQSPDGQLLDVPQDPASLRGKVLRLNDDGSAPDDNEHPWQGRTFEDVLGDIDEPRCEWFTAMQCHSDLATEPPHTSGLFGMDNLLIDHPGYCTMYTLTEGNEGLVTALAGRVRSPVSLRTAVTHVAAGDETGVRVTLRNHAGERREVELDALIVTLPPAGIRTIRWRDERLRDAVADHVRHHDHGTAYLRVTLLFRRRFWRQEFPEDYFVSDAFGGVTVYDQSPDDGAAGVGIQSWLLGGAPAIEYASKPDGEIVAAVLDAMPGVTPARDGLLVRACVDRWTGVAGVSALPGGVPLRPLRQRHCPDPRRPQLQFIGDYLYDATLCGALDAVLYGLSRLDEQIGAKTGSATNRASDLFAAASAETSPAAPASPRSAFFLDERLAGGPATRNTR